MIRYVYFLKPVGMAGPVKIGSSILPAGRLLAYHRISPFPLELVAKIPGPISLEERFHAKFIGQRSHHEWFHPSVELANTILAIVDGSFDIGTLPEPARLFSCARKAKTPEREADDELRGAVFDRLRLTPFRPDHAAGDREAESAARHICDLTGEDRLHAVAIMRAYLKQFEAA